MVVKKHIIGLSLGVTLTLLVAGVRPAFADSSSQLQNQINQIHNSQDAKKAQVDQNKKKLSAVRKQSDAAVQEINQLVSEITDTQNRINKKQSDINHTKAHIKQLKQNISAAKKRIKRRNELLKKRVRYMYENGSTVSVLQVLLGSQDFSDFVSRVYALNLVNKQDKQLLDKQIADKKTLEADQAKVKKELSDLNQQLDSLQNLKSQYSEKQKKQQSLIKQLKIKEIEVQTNISNQQDALQAMKTKVSKLNAQRAEALKKEAEARKKAEEAKKATESHNAAASTHSSSQSVTHANSQESASSSSIQPLSLHSVNANSLIAYSEQFMGLPYIWGGTTPNPGFDCSGFTQYVFRHFGVSLARTAAGQFSGGESVSKSELKPGDLVFFSTYKAGASHVGIYMGGGDMIDSEDNGLVIDNMNYNYWSSRYIGARRYIH